MYALNKTNQFTRIQKGTIITFGILYTKDGCESCGFSDTTGYLIIMLEGQLHGSQNCDCSRFVSCKI